MHSRLLHLQRTLTISILSTVCSLSAFAGQTVNSIIGDFYPFYYAPEDCRGVVAEDDTANSEASKDSRKGYCIAIDQQIELGSGSNKRLYILVTGDVAFSPMGGNVSGHYTDSGLVGMLVLKPDETAGGWEVEYANPTMNAGIYGKGLRDWELIQVSPTRWGFMNVYGDAHGEMAFANYIVVTPDPLTGEIVHSDIGKVNKLRNNVLSASKCADRRVEYCTNLKADLEVDNTNFINGFYSLMLTVNGHQYDYAKSQRMTYHNDVFQIHYKPGQGYLTPVSYPFE